MGATRLVNVSMKPSSTQDLVYVWAVTAKGEALFRTGVSSKCPEGLDWTHVSSDVGKADSKLKIFTTKWLLPKWQLFNHVFLVGLRISKKQSCSHSAT